MMEILDESPVLPSQIDTLGHMNVRYYMTRVMRAHERLMASHGLTDERCAAANLRLPRTDSYCRYQAEQFVDARLQVQGGLIEVGAQGVRGYYQVYNPDRQQLAANFILGFTLEDIDSREPRALPADIAEAAWAAIIALPPHGVPRSVSLDRPRFDVDLADIERRRSSNPHSDLTSQRIERVIDPEDCDERGYLISSDEIMFGARRREEILRNPERPMGPPTFVSAGGQRFGWAWLETRNLLVARPRVGDRVVSIGADIAFQRKTRQSRRWTFNLTTGELAVIEDTVGIALDLDARRSIEIPPEVRIELERHSMPEAA